MGWELGYGKDGSFSFSNVPPMADLLYEVKLIGFDDTKELSCSLLSLELLWIYGHLIPKGVLMIFPRLQYTE